MRIRMVLLLASLGVGVGLMLPSAARADTATCYPSCPPPVIHVTPGGSPQATTATPTAQATSEPPTGDGGLPFTGADIAGLSLVGAAALGAGVVLVHRSRRARATEGS
jgi:hypothetical protein